jgi:hypothetical protein
MTTLSFSSSGADTTCTYQNRYCTTLSHNAKET